MSRRRLDEDREVASARPAEGVPAPSGPSAPAETILRLQAQHGNAAVARMIARNPHPAPAAGVTPPSGAPPVPEEERVRRLEAAYAAAVAGKDFGAAAKTLNAFNDTDIAAKLAVLGEPELRLMDDGAQRAMPGYAQRIRDAVRVALKSKGVSDDKAKAGAQFGEIRISVGTIKHGEGDKRKYEYPVDIHFKPDPAAVAAEEIAFIQTVRLVDTKTGDNREWDKANLNRATERKSSIDRLTGKKQGWYGMEDNSSNGGLLRKWTRADAATNTEAWMYDAPGSAKIDSATWEFETAAVSRKGPDAGTVYATVTWGFTVDDKMKVTALPNKIFNKPSSEFHKAVGKWNAQAKGPVADSNVPSGGGQVELPTPK